MDHTEMKKSGADAWAAFCDTLKEAGLGVLGSSAEDELEMAEGLRFVAGMVDLCLDMFVANTDAEHPALRPLMTPTRKFGIDNPDTHYDVARIDGAHTYRVTGTRGSVHYLAFTLYEMSVDDPSGGRCVGNLSDADIAVGPDGSFEVVLSPDPHPGNWLQLTPDVDSLAIRQYFLDRGTEVPATYAIEAVGVPAVPEPPQMRRLARGIDRAGRALALLTQVCSSAPLMLASAVNELRHFPGAQAASMYGTPDNDYMIGMFDLAPDEALVVEGTPPAARYWNLHLTDRWTASLDYRYHTVSLNASQVVLEPDGRFRVVVSATDPKVANWIDTAGHRRGLMTLRWMLAEATPIPECRVVKLSDLPALFA